MSDASTAAALRHNFGRIEAIWSPTGDPPPWATDPETYEGEEPLTLEAQFEEIDARVQALADRLSPPA